MRRWLPLLFALLALLAGLTLGLLSTGVTAQARVLSDDTLIDQALNYQPRAVITASGVQVSEPAPLPRSAQATRQFYIISDATGDICDVRPDPP